MPDTSKSFLLKLSPMGYLDLFFVTTLTIIIAGVLVVIGYLLPKMAFYFLYPVSGIIVLGLLIYNIYKIKVIREGLVETIIFTADGIHFENRRIGLRELVKWSKIVDIFVVKVDEDDAEEDEEKEPNKVIIITPHSEEIIFLADYESIFTNRKTLWEQIQEIFSTYKQEVTIPNDETVTIPNT